MAMNTTETKARNEIINDGILRGYTTKEAAYEVKDYPYGYTLRTSIFYWIETKEGKGDRLGTYTINPKTGRINAPKYSTYSTFLYLYISEDNGHVKTGGINSFDKEKFADRFPFLIEKYGVSFLTDAQKKNIRSKYLSLVMVGGIYEKAKYSAEMKPVFTKWLSETGKHITTCPFEKMLDYPVAPEQDNPNGEITFVSSTHEEVKPTDPQHSITAEKIEEILKRVLPNFYVSVSPYKGFNGSYLQIMAAVNTTNNKKVQEVSLSLNLRTLDLQPQIYGGIGGRTIYREPNTSDPSERFLAMKSEKIPFRTPKCNEKDVLAAIERFATNYKATLIEYLPNLKYQDLVHYQDLLNPQLFV